MSLSNATTNFSISIVHTFAVQESLFHCSTAPHRANSFIRKIDMQHFHQSLHHLVVYACSDEHMKCSAVHTQCYLVWAYDRGGNASMIFQSGLQVPLGTRILNLQFHYLTSRPSTIHENMNLNLEWISRNNLQDPYFLKTVALMIRTDLMVPPKTLNHKVSNVFECSEEMYVEYLHVHAHKYTRFMSVGDAWNTLITVDPYNAHTNQSFVRILRYAKCPLRITCIINNPYDFPIRYGVENRDEMCGAIFITHETKPYFNTVSNSFYQ